MIMIMIMIMVMAMAKAMAMAAAAAAAAVIRPEHAEGGRNHENRLLLKNAVLGLFWSF